MEDLRSNAIQEIKMLMVNKLSREEVSALNSVLISVLDKYNLEYRSTELSIYDDSNENAMLFFCNKMRLDGLSDNTIKQYKRATEHMLNFIGKNFTEITEFDVMKYFANLSTSVSNNTYNNYRIFINQFFSYYHHKGVIRVNPMDDIKKVKVQKVTKKAFTSAERDCLRDNCSCDRDRALLEVLYSTACRISEIMSANISDINGDELRVYSHKTKKEMTVYLDDSAKYYLNIYLKNRNDNNDALFVSRKKIGGEYIRMTKDSAELLCRKLGKKCGIENVHPHRFRRTKATNLLNSNMPLQEVQIVLGHQSPDTTTRYYDPNNNLIKSNVLRLSS